MKNVNVKLTSVEMTRYARNEPTILKIFFNDGNKEHYIEKTSSLDSLEELSSQIMNDIKKNIKDMNSKDGPGIFDNIVTVIFGDIDDEEKAEEKLTNSLRRIKDDIRKLKMQNTAQNYLQRLAMFQKSRYSI